MIIKKTKKQKNLYKNNEHLKIIIKTIKIK